MKWLWILPSPLASDPADGGGPDGYVESRQPLGQGLLDLLRLAGTAFFTN